MPKQKRWAIKQECDTLKSELVKALLTADKIKRVYYPNYPELYLYPQLWIDSLRAIVESVGKFREEI